MPCLEEIRYGDIGTIFRGTFYDEAGAIQSISDATSKYMIFRKPGGTVVWKTGSFFTDGSDGKLQYTTVSGDLNEVGKWQLQPRVITPSGEWTADIEEFFVGRVLWA